jgi:regulator of RNase E activity RraA
MSSSDDTALFAAMRRELFSAVLGDVLDTLGCLHQFLPPGLRPLRDDMVVLGRAMPVLEADFFGADEPAGQTPLSRQPFGLMFAALDSLQPNEVYVAAGGSPAYALWGELMSTRALRLGAAGAVVNGYSRDTHGILRLNFPTFSLGRYAVDQRPRGKVVDYRVPVAIGGVRIAPGDIIFGDIDGVVVVPQVVETDALRLAFEKVRQENLVRSALEAGLSTVEAFARFGIM